MTYEHLEMECQSLFEKMAKDFRQRLKERQVKGLTENFWNQGSDSSGEDSTYEADEKQKEKCGRA